MPRIDHYKINLFSGYGVVGEPILFMHVIMFKHIVSRCGKNSRRKMLKSNPLVCLVSNGSRKTQFKLKMYFLRILNLKTNVPRIQRLPKDFTFCVQKFPSSCSFFPSFFYTFTFLTLYVLNCKRCCIFSDYIIREVKFTIIMFIQ